MKWSDGVPLALLATLLIAQLAYPRAPATSCAHSPVHGQMEVPTGLHATPLVPSSLRSTEHWAPGCGLFIISWCCAGFCALRTLRGQAAPSKCGANSTDNGKASLTVAVGMGQLFKRPSGRHPAKYLSSEWALGAHKTVPLTVALLSLLFSWFRQTLLTRGQECLEGRNLKWPLLNCCGPGPEGGLYAGRVTRVL